MKVSRYPCRKLLSPLKPSSSLRPASPFQHLTSAFSYSSELFCTRQKLNSFLFKQFRTLSQKHPGVGYPSRSIFRLPFTLPRKERISKPFVFYSLRTLSFSVACKPFICYSLVPPSPSVSGSAAVGIRKLRGWIPTLPILEHHSQVPRLALGEESRDPGRSVS